MQLSHTFDKTCILALGSDSVTYEEEGIRKTLALSVLGLQTDSVQTAEVLARLSSTVKRMLLPSRLCTAGDEAGVAPTKDFTHDALPSETRRGI